MAIQILKSGDKLPDLPRGVNYDDREYAESKYGFKIVYAGGSPRWQEATESDFRNSEAGRLGVSPDNVPTNTACHSASPGRCGGSCLGMDCTRVYNPQDHYHYCTCP